MNSKEIERLYFEWVGIYKGLEVRNTRDYLYSLKVRRMVEKFSYLLGLC